MVLRCLVQDCGISSAYALELPQSCTKPLHYCPYKEIIINYPGARATRSMLKISSTKTQNRSEQ